MTVVLKATQPHSKSPSSSSFSLFKPQLLTSYTVIWEIQVLGPYVIVLSKTVALFSTGGFHT